MCFAVAIGINKLSHQIVCAILVGGGKYEIYFSYVIDLVKNSTKEESVQSPDRFVSNSNYRLLFRSLSEALEIAKCFE